MGASWERASPQTVALFEVAPLVTRVAGIDQHATRRKARGEVLNDGPDEFAVLAGAEGDLLARRNLNRDSVLLALLGVAGNQRFTLGQIGGQAVMPCRRAEGTQQVQRGRLNLVAPLWAVDGPRWLVWVCDR